MLTLVTLPPLRCPGIRYAAGRGKGGTAGARSMFISIDIGHTVVIATDYVIWMILDHLDQELSAVSGFQGAVMVRTVIAIVAAVSAGALYTAAAAKVVKQYERGVVLRLGRLRNDVRGPGFTMVLPGIERLRKVNMQIVTMPVPAQDGITRDNVTVRVDAVIYFKVVDAASAVIQVEDYRFAVSQMAQTSLRSIIGKSDLDDLLSNREKLNQGLELMIDSPAVGWGVQIDRVEIKDVSLPETMKRSMARQAEADRERRARVINADAEPPGVEEARRGGEGDVLPAGRAPAASVADGGGGGGGEELHAGAAVPGGAAPLPGTGAAARPAAARPATARATAGGAAADRSAAAPRTGPARRTGSAPRTGSAEARAATAADVVRGVRTRTLAAARARTAERGSGPALASEAVGQALSRPARTSPLPTVPRPGPTDMDRGVSCRA